MEIYKLFLKGENILHCYPSQKVDEQDGEKQEQKPKGNQLGAQTGMCPVAKWPGVPEGKHAW